MDDQKNSAGPEKKTILIIEDSAFQSKLIRRHVQLTTDLPVLEAHTLAEAEAVLREYSDEIFLALVDLNLEDAPDGQALDLCLKWEVPSMVLTARLDEQVREKCLHQHVVDYFIKGSIADMDPLLAAVERVYKNQSLTALVVDDSHTQRAAVRKLLEVQRLNVLEADSGEAALTVLEEHPEIRLVVTDFHMPGMGGLELVRQARAKRRLDELSIIGLSSAGSGPLTARFLKNGANDFLTKPFENEEFYWRINQSLTTQDLMRTMRDIRQQHE